MKSVLVLLLSLTAMLVSIPDGKAQSGGHFVYQVLNLPPSARSAALGGFVIASPNSDAALAYHNPALLNSQMHNRISLNYSNYLSDIQYGYLSYARDLGKWGMAAAGLQHINYGHFTEANEFGDILGSFSAAEYSFNLSYAYQIDSLLTVGATIRPIYSVLERYVSWGLTTDLGILYHRPESRLYLSLVARNLGWQLTTYATPTREPLPFEVLAGMSYQLRHAPFRLYLTARNLQQYNLRRMINEAPADAGFFDKAGLLATTSLNHLAAAVEFIPGNLIALRVGYSFLRGSELGMSGYRGATGFSFGGGVNLGRIEIDYALASYHPAAMSHTISLRIGMGKLA
ncbi:MAG: type IX secretion system protein PorQ [Bacteroidales bacterium]|nr:type IX secretion system protein PorQ [Bacteroidales bacterium]